MSDRRYQNARNRRPLYGPGSQRNNSTLTYWVPLVVTATLAIGGVAAWIWSERSEDDDDDDQDYSYGKPPGQGPGPTGTNSSQGPYPPQSSQPYPGGPGQGTSSMSLSGPLPSQTAGPQGGPPGTGYQGSSGVGEAASYYNADGSRAVQQQQQAGEDGGWMGRVSGTLRRTPSPQQFFDQASRQVSAGMTAAGAALGSIMEEDGSRDRGEDRRGRAGREEREREGFSDHERWSEEAEEKRRVGDVEAESERRADVARSGRDVKGKGRAKMTVAVVVNADTGVDGQLDEDDGGYRTEHASILSHLPSTFDPTNTDLFVLIHAPTLTSLPPLDYKPSSSPLSSSYGTITTPRSELRSMSPHPASSSASIGATKAFDSLYTAALSLVSHPSQILPFTTATGYIHILRHLAPQLVYLTDSAELSGREGESVAQLKGWVGQTVLVVGDEGHGGLADTETETDEEGVRRERREEDRWYERSGLVGLGKGLEVVDAAKVGDDWGRRVGGRE
ncbi:hypothetical protein MBLNU230_g6080t1 [Neophaeotheca triangularis]